MHNRLRALTPTASPDLQAAWEATALSDLPPAPRAVSASLPEQFLILVTCRDEQHQVELLTRLQRDGLDCKPLIS